MAATVTANKRVVDFVKLWDVNFSFLPHGYKNELSLSDVNLLINQCFNKMYPKNLKATTNYEDIIYKIIFIVFVPVNRYATVIQSRTGSRNGPDIFIKLKKSK